VKLKLLQLGRWSVAALSVGVAVFSYRYVVNLRFVPPNVAANRYYTPWIFIHASAAATALLLGPLQLLDVVRGRWPKIHRGTGWAYIMSSLVGGLSGFILAPGVSTGPLWVFVTIQGLRAARARDFPGHRRWMIRSFALTFSAVTLRLYIVLSQILGLDFGIAYRAIAWLAWMPNALFAEWFLRRGSSALKKPRIRRAPRMDDRINNRDAAA
jgi:uncharacterized membrane protein